MCDLRCQVARGTKLCETHNKERRSFLLTCQWVEIGTYRNINGEIRAVCMDLIDWGLGVSLRGLLTLSGMVVTRHDPLEDIPKLSSSVHSLF